jgi:hypothetical protein
MENKSPEANWLRLSEEKNALDYLEHAATFIRQTSDDVMAWKWVIIALHGALYGFAIAACRGTDSQSVVTKKGKLIGFWEAMERCQDPHWMKMLVHSKHLELGKSQKDSIDLLKSIFRNEFEHFKPKGWSIEIHGMPQIAIDVLEVIRFLALETNTFVQLSEEEDVNIKTLVENSISFIRGTRLYKEMKPAQEVGNNLEPN